MKWIQTNHEQQVVALVGISTMLAIMLQFDDVP